jgi:RND family efflux transporter MFP subunit
MTSFRRGVLWRYALSALLIGAIVGCQKKAGGPGGPGGPMQKMPEVSVKNAVQKSVLDYEEFTGRTEAMRTVVIRSRVTGYLDRVFFEDGQEVQEGTPLFQIDDRVNKANLESFEAAVIQADAHAKRLDDEFRRAGRLFATKAMSQEDFNKVAGDRAEAEAALKKARADRDRAKVDLGYTLIKAPITGRISRAFVDPHNLIKADDTALTSIVSVDPMYAYFDVDERTYLRLTGETKRSPSARSEADPPPPPEFLKAPVDIGLATEKGYPHKGKINFIDNALDVGTGTMRFRCEIPNADRKFSAGLFVRVKLPLGKPQTRTLVPEKAIGTDQGQKFVFVVDNSDDVVYRAVKIGSLQDGWRVVLEGVAPGERVIISGLQRVRPRVRVTVTDEDAPPPAGQAKPAAEAAKK